MRNYPKKRWKIGCVNETQGKRSDKLSYRLKINNIYAYYYLEFTQNGVRRESFITINRDDPDFPLWAEHHRNREFIENPTIFGTDRPLFPIEEQIELRNVVLEELRKSVPPMA